jgi:CcmD family protein
MFRGIVESRVAPHKATAHCDQLNQGSAKRERERMKNLNYLVAAYIAIWVVFCGYLFSVARRMASLQDDIRRLKRDGK